MKAVNILMFYLSAALIGAGIAFVISGNKPLFYLLFGPANLLMLMRGFIFGPLYTYDEMRELRKGYETIEGIVKPEAP